ncbi:MAG: hypothetical protein QM751_05980 [Paludibacteraceae bacterium]
MKTQTIIIGIIGAILVLYFMWTKFKNQTNEPNKNTTKPSSEYLPKQEKQNDKLVFVDDITKTEIDRILTGFCNMYNEKSFKALPRLYKISERQFVIIFPFDIEFEILCYFVNYVRYPMGFNKSFDVKAWTTTRSGEIWITEKTANKKVMLFIPQDDTEHDNVYLTTSDNIGYKLGFAMGEEKQLLDTPKIKFIESKIEFGELKGKEFNDYK